MFEVLNRVRVSLLLKCNASELIARVDLLRIDLERAFKPLTRLVQLTTVLMNQTQIVVRGSIRRIQCGGFKILLERCLRAMTADNVAEETTQQQKQQNQETRRAENT